MADYSFFKPQLGFKLSSEYLKNLAVAWILVAENAIRSIGYVRDLIINMIQELDFWIFYPILIRDC